MLIERSTQLHQYLETNMSPLTVARKARGLNQTTLARLAGTGQSQISKLERGDRTLSPEWAVRLAPHLGVKALSLLRIDLQQNLLRSTRPDRPRPFYL